jgi:GntR family transcriptional regulator
MPKFDRDLPIPLYHQLKTVLMDSIDSGQWQAGQQLPTEEKLAENFGVSKITVRQALRDLADLGYVRRERGRGTFVSKPKFDQGPRELMSFTQEMHRHHLTAGSSVLECNTVDAAELVAESLQLRAGEPVFVLKRLRSADGEPMGIQTAHIPQSLVPDLVSDNLENISLYEVIRIRYGLQPAKARETYFAIPAEPEIASLLAIPEGWPVFSVQRVTYLANGKPFEFVQSLLRGDRYNIILELAANRVPQATREGGTQ